MGYDLMVFDPESAPRKRSEFMTWFQKQAEWSEDHDYDDPAVSTPALKSWFLDMIKEFPAMNGPYALEHDDLDDARITDYCVGQTVIYVAFAWSQAEPAYDLVVELAKRHGLGFFDVSSHDGEIRFPDMTI